MVKIITIILFAFLNIINFSCLSLLPTSTPEWEKYADWFIDFIHFLIVSSAVLGFLYYKFYRKNEKNATSDLCLSVVFYAFLIGLVPSIFWYLQYNPESNIYPFGRKLALIYFMASFALYFNTSLVGLVFSFLPPPQTENIKAFTKAKYFLLLMFSSLFLSSVWFTTLWF